MRSGNAGRYTFPRFCDLSIDGDYFFGARLNVPHLHYVTRNILQTREEALCFFFAPYG